MSAKPITFAVRLQELLAEADITGYELAKRCRIPRQTVGRFLRGERKPTFENVLRIAKALKVSLSVFDNVAITPPTLKG
jgi:transcriptional regulator with XRE-family HTH domain